MSPNLAAIGYLIAAVCFIVSLRGLSSPATSQRGLQAGILGMGLAILITLLSLQQPSVLAYVLIAAALVIGGGAGFYIARTVAMTAMPQLVAAFHSLVGLAAVFVAAGAFASPEAFHILVPGTTDTIKGLSLVEMGLGAVVGAITFTGSIIAFAKLQAIMGSAPIMLPARHVINIAIGVVILLLLIWLIMAQSTTAFVLLILCSLLIGVLLIIPIGGADMPVVVSMLNSYSGWAAAALGFTLGNLALIITGALVGSSGAILSYIMCKGMNRSFISVILGGFGGETATGGADDGIERTVKQGSADDAAYLMMNAQKVIIVPGYGMAVAQAQHAVREMADKLKANGVEVKYAIHPVAGRM
ncbi:MAG TPA: NAD(P)(+) transhydrogenase (Re/Si-specific) subunit beta, partial [Geminicoccus sp.]|uniref:NAD(P)(+) transhydrogenase (Re/Si-specific) subunit beta n=1 Tax=Geminicoccus sp. TaxID=2024832 RepID=UPI002CDB566A